MTVDDVIAGRAAGLSTADVTIGAGTPEALAVAGQDVLVAHLSEPADLMLRS